MGLLDEILKSLEEAQREAEGRRAPAPRQARPAAPQPMPMPERNSGDDDEESEDEAEDLAQRRQVLVMRRPAPQPVAPRPEPPRRTVADSAPAVARHVVSGPQAADRVRAMLRNPQALRDALIAREILGPPPGLQRIRRLGRR